MLELMRCVAEAVVANGVRGLMEMVPGGGFVHDVAVDAHRRLKERQRDAQLRQELAKLVAASPSEARRAAEQAVTQAGLKGQQAQQVAQYLANLPQAARQSMKRPDDPSGRSVAANFALRGAQDVERLLPLAAPRFSPGDRPPSLRGWVLEELLGVGGFGEVWLARHGSASHLRSAVKFARGLSDGERRVLEHESKLVAEVMKSGPHHGIVPLQDFDVEHEDTPWLRFEYVEGGDLADVVRAWQKLGHADRAKKAVACLRDLADTVAHFHGRRRPVVHRDLKPSNILLDRSTNRKPAGLDFQPRITDFGIGGLGAKRQLDGEKKGVTSKTMRMASFLRGSHTPLYASQQQRDGEPEDPRDDVHALGVIGYQMLTGDLHQGAGTDFAEDLREVGAGQALIDVLGRCVAQRADRRYKDAAELAARLAQLRPTDVAGASATRTPLMFDAPAAREPISEVRLDFGGDELATPPPAPAPPPVTLSGVLSSRCPECLKTFRLPATSLGKRVKCSSCHSVFTVEATPAEKPAPLKAAPPKGSTSKKSVVSFKQQCPSCEAMVPVRDPALVGKKIECPKCRYRFAVEEPVEEDAPWPKSSLTKTPKGGRLRDDDDDDDRPVKKARKKKGSPTLQLVSLAIAGLAMIFLFMGCMGLYKWMS